MTYSAHTRAFTLPQLSKAGLRLLKALGEPGTVALADPTREDGLIVRGGAAAGISLGRGSYTLDVARELLDRDLIERVASARTSYGLSAAGAANLRRENAPKDSSAFSAQHLELSSDEVEVGGVTSRVVRNAAESPLAWLRRRKDREGDAMIDAPSYEAGERLRRDLTVGGVLPSVTARWESGIGSGGAGPRDPAGATDAMIAARQRVTHALDAVGGDLANLLVDLCGFLKGLEVIEREHHWPPRSAKVVVRLALRRLAEHYGLGVEARGPARSRGIRLWRDPDEMREPAVAD